MIPPPSKRLPPIRQLLEIMASLRSAQGCPWDREQDHKSLRWHAVEEVYELMDAIEAGDDEEMTEELGDLLLQVVFHAQLGRERGVFDFDGVCNRLAAKLIRRHPHVFGDVTAESIDEVWANWEAIKKAEKAGSRAERKSMLDGVPRHLPALSRAQKLFKKARKAGLEPATAGRKPSRSLLAERAKELFELAASCENDGISAEELLRTETARREAAWRKAEARATKAAPTSRSAGKRKARS
jgi:tetrapyrrole methylase family protein / MazG family protein